MMNRLLHKIARVIAVCTTMTIAPTLLWRMAERIGPSSMSIPLPIGVPRSPCRLDGDPQCAAEDTRSQNLAISMLPPETTATIGPGPAFPVGAAARDND